MRVKKKLKKLFSPKFLLFLFIGIILSAILLVFFPAEFFDIFGISVWVFFLGLGGWMLLTDKETPDWIAYIILIIGVLGLIVDGYIVIKTFLL